MDAKGRPGRRPQKLRPSTLSSTQANPTAAPAALQAKEELGRGRRSRHTQNYNETEDGVAEVLSDDESPGERRWLGCGALWSPGGSEELCECLACSAWHPCAVPPMFRFWGI